MRNRVDLAGMLGPALRRRRRWLVRPPRPSRGTELGMLRAMLVMLRAAEDRVRARVLPAVSSVRSQLARDAAEELGWELEVLRADLERELVGAAAATAERVIELAAQRHGENWVGAIRRVLGVDLSGAVRSSDLSDELALAARQNAELIRSLAGQFHGEVATLTTRSVLAGESHDRLRGSLQERFRVVRSRAELIARDQSQKLTGSLNQLRQQQVGVGSYVWSTSRDERVRPSHAAKEGREFRWDAPPPDTGHPGHDVNCRCVAVAVVELDEEVVG